MSEQANTKTVKQLYAHVGGQHLSGAGLQPLLNLCSDDVEWDVPQMEGVRLCGQRIGHDGVREFFTTMSNDLDAVKFEPQRFIAQGNTVVALGHYAWRVKATGKEFSSDWAHVFTLRDGKIVRFKEYMDTAAEMKAHEKSKRDKSLQP